MMHTKESKNKWLVLLIVVLSTFMSALDSSIVNVALPKMATTLSIETSMIQLVATIYLIVIVGTVLIFGRLGDILGKTKVFKSGIAMFTLGSFLCGISNSFLLLLLSRGIQAIGASAIMANNQGIITEIFPSSERGRALGLSGTAVALGSIVGPGLGGIIVGSIGWHMIFLVNIPIGILVFLLALTLLPPSSKLENQSIDIAGALLFILSIVPLFFGLSQSIKLGFSHMRVVGLLVVSVISFILFVKVEKKKASPLIQLKIFKNGLFTLSLLCGFISFVALFCNNIILPFYLQDVMSYSPQVAGVILMIFPFVLMIVAPVSGYASDKVGSEILTVIGLMTISSSLFMMSNLNETSSLGMLITFIGFLSVGTGMFQSPNNSLIMSTVPKVQLGIAGSINALVRNLGMVTGITVATTLLYGVMSAKLGMQVTDYMATDPGSFIVGMKTVYRVASCISLVGAILTILRIKRK